MDYLEQVPDTLLDLLGKLRLVMELELHEGRKLAQADIDEVMSALSSNGYYLQLPPENFYQLL